MNAPEPNQDVRARLIGHQRMKAVPQSERAGGLKGCAYVLGTGVVSLVVVLILFGWVKVGGSIAVLGLILIAFVFVLSKKIEALTRAKKDAEQKERDAKAVEILVRVRNQRALERPLLLYLRPSAEEAKFSWCIGMLGTWGIGMPENSGPFAAAVARRDFEGVIAKLSAPLGDLLTVSGEKTIGGGRIKSTDEEWEEVVKALCNAASAIFVLPASSGGVTKEIELLYERKYLSKTVFIMPPEIVEDTPDNVIMRNARRKSSEFRGTADGRCQFLNLGVADYWSETRQHLSQKGVELPPFRENGLAFSLSDESKQVCEICTLTSYLPAFSEVQHWIMKHQLQAPLRMREIRERWGDSVYDDSRTVQIWPLLSHLLDLVKPTR
jgi:hypothetical protein